jgi:hypothetical protein
MVALTQPMRTNDPSFGSSMISKHHTLLSVIGLECNPRAKVLATSNIEDP